MCPDCISLESHNFVACPHPKMYLSHNFPTKSSQPTHQHSWCWFLWQFPWKPSGRLQRNKSPCKPNCKWSEKSATWMSGSGGLYRGLPSRANSQSTGQLLKRNLHEVNGQKRFNIATCKDRPEYFVEGRKFLWLFSRFRRIACHLVRRFFYWTQLFWFVAFVGLFVVFENPFLNLEKLKWPIHYWTNETRSPDVCNFSRNNRNWGAWIF